MFTVQELEFVKPALAKEGVELDIKVFNDYIQPNVQVADGHLDASFFEHQLPCPTTRATARDVTSNPRRLKFKELEAATLPRVLPDVDLALINTNYALEAGLDPTADALLIEDKDSPYANLIVTRAAHQDDPAVQKLMQALQTDAVRDFIIKRYQGAVVPAF